MTRELVMNSFVTLDGVTQAAGEELGAEALNSARKYVANAEDARLEELRAVVVGDGKKLFANGARPASLKLVDQIVTSTRVVIASYVRGGDVAHGSLAHEQPSPEEIDRRKKVARE